MVKIIFHVVGSLIITCLWFGTASAQIKATTQDGKKVILGLDGTWKYEIEEIEKDSSLLKGLSAARDTTSASSALNEVPVVKDSVPAPPPPPVRKPPNLDCSVLIAVQRAMDNQSFVATLKNLVVSKDSKTGFVISFYKSKHRPFTWTTKVMGNGVCITDKTEMILLLKDGSSFKFEAEEPGKCDGNFKLTFGGDIGNEYAFEMIKKVDIKAIRIWNPSISVEEYVHEYDAAIFRSGINCLVNLK